MGVNILVPFIPLNARFLFFSLPFWCHTVLYPCRQEADGVKEEQSRLYRRRRPIEAVLCEQTEKASSCCFRLQVYFAEQRLLEETLRQEGCVFEG